MTGLVDWLLMLGVSAIKTKIGISPAQSWRHNLLSRFAQSHTFQIMSMLWHMCMFRFFLNFLWILFRKCFFKVQPKVIFQSLVPHPHPSTRLTAPAPSPLPASLRLSIFPGLSSTPPLLQPFYRGASLQQRPEDAETAALKGNSAFLLSTFSRVAHLHVYDSANTSDNIWRADGQAGRRAEGAPTASSCSDRGKIAGRVFGGQGLSLAVYKSVWKMATSSTKPLKVLNELHCGEEIKGKAMCLS